MIDMPEEVEEILRNALWDSYNAHEGITYEQLRKAMDYIDACC